MKAYFVTALFCLMFMVGTVYVRGETVSKLVIADKGVSHYAIVVTACKNTSRNIRTEIS